MVEWNPLPHMRHAWDSPKTVYGKLAVIVFYTFIWVGIISSALTVIFPASQGNQCALDSTEGPIGKQSLLQMTRSANIVWVGFLVYADVGGLTIKNVAMVTIVMCAFMLSFLPSIALLNENGCKAALSEFLVYPAWTVIALVLTIIDYYMTDHGTAEETRNLVV